MSTVRVGTTHSLYIMLRYPHCALLLLLLSHTHTKKPPSLAGCLTPAALGEAPFSFHEQ